VSHQYDSVDFMMNRLLKIIVYTNSCFEFAEKSVCIKFIDEDSY
jgi:hypothetical protein